MVRLCFALLLLRKEQDRKHWGFSFFYRLLSSRKIRQIPMGYCALKTVWAQAHGGSNPSASASERRKITFSRKGSPYGYFVSADGEGETGCRGSRAKRRLRDYVS